MILLFVPAFFLLLFGYALNWDIRDVRFAVDDRDRTVESRSLVSAFAKYANGIKGSEQYLPEEMKGAPEVEIPAEFVANGHFFKLCEPDVTALYSKIWTELLK